jgi:hypothetical protein
VCLLFQVEVGGLLIFVFLDWELLNLYGIRVFSETVLTADVILKLSILCAYF